MKMRRVVHMASTKALKSSKFWLKLSHFGGSFFCKNNNNDPILSSCGTSGFPALWFLHTNASAFYAGSLQHLAKSSSSAQLHPFQRYSFSSWFQYVASKNTGSMDLSTDRVLSVIGTSSPYYKNKSDIAHFWAWYCLVSLWSSLQQDMQTQWSSEGWIYRDSSCRSAADWAAPLLYSRTGSWS